MSLNTYEIITDTPKLALVITQYIEAYNERHSGGLSPGLLAGFIQKLVLCIITK